MQNARITDILAPLRAKLPQRDVALPNAEYPYVVDVEIARADLDDEEYIHVVGVLERAASDLVAGENGEWASGALRQQGRLAGRRVGFRDHMTAALFRLSAPHTVAKIDGEIVPMV